MPKSLITSFSMEPIDENEELLKRLKILGVKDGDNMSIMIRKAILEYVERHEPGNSQLILGHWAENVPLPLTLQEICNHQFGLVPIPDVKGAKWSRCLKCGARP